MQDQIGQLERLGEEWAAAELRGDTATLGRLLAEGPPAGQKRRA